MKHVQLEKFLTDATAARFWSHVDKSGGPDACWPWTAGRSPEGYGRFQSGGRGTPKIRAHRVAYALTTGQDPGELLVLHSCDNPPCCNGTHLFTGDHDTNMTDMAVKGRIAGERNPGSKLTEAQVELIKDLIMQGRKNTEIALLVPVGHAMISRIRRGKAWGTIPLSERYQSLHGPFTQRLC